VARRHASLAGARARERDLEITVRDRSDGRFVPAARVFATLLDDSGREIGTHGQPLLWHPMLYHYGRNWTLPEDGRYTLRVQVEPPTCMRHDEVNGRRFQAPADIDFEGVEVQLGSD
jgi:Fe2+ transport protein